MTPFGPGHWTLRTLSRTKRSLPAAARTSSWSRFQIQTPEFKRSLSAILLSSIKVYFYIQTTDRSHGPFKLVGFGGTWVIYTLVSGARLLGRIRAQHTGFPTLLVKSYCLPCKCTRRRRYRQFIIIVSLLYHTCETGIIIWIDERNKQCD